MNSAGNQLADDAIAIWRAGVDAVLPENLFRDRLRVISREPAGGWSIQLRTLEEDLCDWPIPSGANLFVFGGGKAVGAMGSALEARLLAANFPPERLSGWLNIPEDPEPDGPVALRHLHQHTARPPKINLPTAAAVEGTRRIARQLNELRAGDVAIALISGGGSALLCDPIPAITLEEKIATTRWLSDMGASIEQINAVRTCLSQVKGGGLLRNFSGQLLALIISDVMGDPLEAIASGPTVPTARDPQAALSLLKQFDPGLSHVPPTVVQYLATAEPTAIVDVSPRVQNKLLANNAVAARAAVEFARRLGYQTELLPPRTPEGTAEKVGEDLARRIGALHRRGGKQCLISGGEPVVQLVNQRDRGLGGRNQQLALAALAVRMRDPASAAFVLLSGGTDGEDGPTDAAGAWISHELVDQAELSVVQSHLQRNDAYHFFQTHGGLLVTGPTQTNVCDLRIVLTES